ncbi:hypothetical protein BDV12DRAFT_172975 [Aspergillus spectabilis]
MLLVCCRFSRCLFLHSACLPLSLFICSPHLLSSIYLSHSGRGGSRSYASYSRNSFCPLHLCNILVVTLHHYWHVHWTCILAILKRKREKEREGNEAIDRAPGAYQHVLRLNPTLHPPVHSLTSSTKEKTDFHLIPTFQDLQAYHSIRSLWRDQGVFAASSLLYAVTDPRLRSRPVDHPYSRDHTQDSLSISPYQALNCLDERRRRAFALKGYTLRASEGG